MEIIPKQPNETNASAYSRMSYLYADEGFDGFSIENSIRWAKLAADNGDGARLREIALNALLGRKNYEEVKSKAEDLLLCAASAGDAKAMYRLGDIYLGKEQISSCADKAADYFKKAALAGLWDAFGEYRLYLDMQRLDSDRICFELAKAMADAGCAWAALEAHLCYRDGIGTDKSFEKADHYLGKSILGGCEAASLLKAMYLKGALYGYKLDNEKTARLRDSNGV